MGLSANHRRASLNTLDTLTLRDKNGFYRILKSQPGVKGSVIVQTCNRVEFYLDADLNIDPSEKVLWHWALETRFKLSEINRIVEKRDGNELVDHLVRLASGLESMLVGEPVASIQGTFTAFTSAFWNRCENPARLLRVLWCC